MYTQARLPPFSLFSFQAKKKGASLLHLTREVQRPMRVGTGWGGGGGEQGAVVLNHVRGERHYGVTPTHPPPPHQDYSKAVCCVHTLLAFFLFSFKMAECHRKDFTSTSFNSKTSQDALHKGPDPPQQ
ncbi:unnamed protein product [Gadus morhua 'NCC']